MNKYKKILFDGNENYNSEIYCEECKSKDVQYREFQTRGSDEPLTLFIKCKKCGFVTIEK